MGFQTINEVITDKYTLVKFVLDKDFSKEDFNRFLGILSRLLDISEEQNKPFGFYIDARGVYLAPINTTKKLIAWMKKEKPRIKEKKMLRASGVCFKSKNLIALLNAAFRIQPTVSPNLISSDLDKCKEFVDGILSEI